jgi:hypothetical protein
MKSSIFVTFSSLFFLSWLALSYVTNVKPEPRLGKGSLPLSAQRKETPAPSKNLVKEIKIASQSKE